MRISTLEAQGQPIFVEFIPITLVTTDVTAHDEELQGQISNLREELETANDRIGSLASEKVKLVQKTNNQADYIKSINKKAIKKDEKIKQLEVRNQLFVSDGLKQYRRSADVSEAIIKNAN